MNAAQLLLLLTCSLAATESAFELTAWPAVIHADEAHRLAFRLSAAAPGSATVGWDGGEASPFALPAGVSEGLLALPHGAGLHHGVARCDGRESAFTIRLAEVASPWPIAALRRGLPVDAEGVPVVLLDRRPTVNDLRRARLAATALPRPAGRPLLVGDPLGGGWRDLDAEQRVACALPFPQHAALLALVDVGQPRTIVWSPGNGALYARSWADESRLCAALGTRLSALGMRPRLVLALPPAPVASTWSDADRQRRQELTSAAQAAGWELCDLAAAAGEARLANRVSDGLYGEQPLGAAL